MYGQLLVAQLDRKAREPGLDGVSGEYGALELGVSEIEDELVHAVRVFLHPGRQFLRVDLLVPLFLTFFVQITYWSE